MVFDAPRVSLKCLLCRRFFFGATIKKIGAPRRCFYCVADFFFGATKKIGDGFGDGFGAPCGATVEHSKMAAERTFGGTESKSAAVSATVSAHRAQRRLSTPKWAADENSAPSKKIGTTEFNRRHRKTVGATMKK